MQRHGAYATTSGVARGAGPPPAGLPAAPTAPGAPAAAGAVTDSGAGTAAAEPPGGAGDPCHPEPAAGSATSDLRGTRPDRLRYPAGDVLVVSGLPGSGKSTLIKRTARGADGRGGVVRRVDSQDTRDRWERRLPALPYGLYRPLARLAHYAGLRRALRSGGSLVVHDCGTLSWVRRWLARDARRRGRSLHLVLLDVPPEVALEGQASRGRGVSGYAFARHRRAVRRLVADAEGGRPPDGCASAVLLDRTAASALHGIGFE